MINAQMFVAGPSDLGVQTGAGGTYELLGWSETEDTVEITFENEPIQNVITGPRLPFDYCLLGIGAQIRSQINVYDETVLEKLMSGMPGLLSNGTLPAPVEGAWSANRIGTLARQEHAWSGLILRCRYATKSVFKAGGMRAGYRFPVAGLVGGVPISLSTRPKRIGLVWQVIPDVNLADGAITLYDADISALPALSP